MLTKNRIISFAKMPLYPEPKFRGPKRTKKPIPQCRVELHNHLDGALRMSTVWELYKQKGINSRLYYIT